MPLRIFDYIENFNPRSPCGERRADLTRTFNDLEISIHAPRAGSDLQYLQ